MRWPSCRRKASLAIFFEGAMEIKKVVNKRIGELVVERRLITRDQLDVAFKEQRLKGGYLSQHLIRLGFVNDVDITMCLASQLGLPYLPLENYNIPNEALVSIPLKYICTYYVVPVEKNINSITIAMADPLNQGVIEIIKRLTNCQVNIFICTYREIKQTILKYYKASIDEINLDKFKYDKTLREDLDNRMIEYENYHGYTRRRYRRLDHRLDAEYFIYPEDVKSSVKNISMGGVLFETKKNLAKGMQIGLVVHLGRSQKILLAVEVIKSASNNLGRLGVNNLDDAYYIAGIFNFISNDDQGILADFLRKNLSRKNKLREK